MSAMTVIPLQVKCSNCEQLLLDAHFDVELDSPITRCWTLVNYVDVICPKCLSELKEANDDFSRILTELAGMNGDEGEGV